MRPDPSLPPSHVFPRGCDWWRSRVGEPTTWRPKTRWISSSATRRTALWRWLLLLNRVCLCIHRGSALSIFELQSVAIAKHNRDECSKLCGSTVGSAADHRSAAVAASEGDRLTISAEIDQRVGARLRNLLMFGLRLRHERVGHRRIPSESHRLSMLSSWRAMPAGARAYVRRGRR